MNIIIILVVLGFIAFIAWLCREPKRDEYIEGRYHMVYEDKEGKEKFAAWRLNMTAADGEQCCVEWFLEHHKDLKNLRAVPTNYQLKK